jgi:hypothetical protein
MFKIMDKQKLFIPVKSGFPTAAKAYNWAKKNLPKDSCAAWGNNSPYYRYFIQQS